MFYTTDDLREEVPDYSNECASALHGKPEKIEEWCWLKPEYYGCVIGKDGDTINQIEEESGANVTIENGIEKCFIRGNEDQRNKAKRLIKKMVKNHSNFVDESYMELDFVKPHQIGKVIGKNGRTIQMLRKEYNVLLKVVERDGRDKVLIKGDPETDQNIKTCIQRVRGISFYKPPSCLLLSLIHI